LSWQPANGDEWLYLSPRAAFGRTEPIRGGVPICFPQFSTLGELPRHGLVRTRAWKIGEKRQGEAAGEKGEVMLTLTLEDDAASRAAWPHQFAAELTVLLSDERLDIELAIENRGSEAFAFTAALHTYLKVADVEDVSLDGLRGLAYRDAADADAVKTERGDVVVIRGEVDRVYRDAPAPLMFKEPSRSLGVHAENFPDVVVWNPGEVRCAAIADLPADGWRHLLCVEAGVIERPVDLPAGETWWGRQTLFDLAAASANSIE
jgi:glucose-6-phosphate 1-epimerase